MANYYTELAPNQVRRADREVTDETWLKALLHRGAVGYLATVQGERPFSVSRSSSGAARKRKSPLIFLALICMRI